MSGNTFGQLFKLTTFGESHGIALGGVVDGCPAGLDLAESFIQERLDMRRPGGQSGSDALATTNRKESDKVRLLSGVFNNKTTGTPIAFVIENENQKSADYNKLEQIFRPGHGDISYLAKYGFRDHRGGGRASARETVARVAGGAIAEALLNTHNIEIYAGTVEFGGVGVTRLEIDMSKAHERPFFAAAQSSVVVWEKIVEKIRARKDTVGGVVRIEARNVPPGLGEPVFLKLDAMLAAAIMSVGAVKGVEVGAGFEVARMRGSENNDPILAMDGCLPRFASNNSGGILGGISSGQDIILHAAIKPIPSIAREQDSIDIAGNAVKLQVGGRHDICAIPRIVPVLKAMTALCLADALLMQRRMGALHDK